MPVLLFRLYFVILLSVVIGLNWLCSFGTLYLREVSIAILIAAYLAYLTNLGLKPDLGLIFYICRNWIENNIIIAIYLYISLHS